MAYEVGVVIVILQFVSNIVPMQPAHSYMPGSDSEDDQPVYDIPPNRFRNLPTETPNIVC